MAQLGQLSAVTVVLIIAGGILTFLLLFIFAKRQIMRFTLRSHRGPFAPFGADANKALRKEIMRRIDAIPKITYEPKVLREDIYTSPDVEKPCHYYRMLAVDCANTLEHSIVKKKLGKRNSHYESLRSFLILILSPEIDPHIVHQFCDLYDAARYNPKTFDEGEYKAFSLLLKQLKHAVSVSQPKSSNRSPKKSSSLSTKDHIIIKQSPEKKKKASGGPYMRKLSNRDKSKWGEDETVELCSTGLHEVSIIHSSEKDESTVV